MLPTYEELIEKMARAYLDYCIEDDEELPIYGRVHCAMKGALQALLESLPPGLVLEEETCGKDFNGNEVIVAQEIIDNRALYYKQLLAMRRINS